MKSHCCKAKLEILKTKYTAYLICSKCGKAVGIYDKKAEKRKSK